MHPDKILKPICISTAGNLMNSDYDSACVLLMIDVPAQWNWWSRGC